MQPQMGFTKAEAIAAIRSTTKGVQAGELLTALDDIDEAVLLSSTVSLAEDGQYGILGSVRHLTRSNQSESHTVGTKEPSNALAASDLTPIPPAAQAQPLAQPPAQPSSQSSSQSSAQQPSAEPSFKDITFIIPGFDGESASVLHIAKSTSISVLREIANKIGAVGVTEDQNSTKGTVTLTPTDAVQFRDGGTYVWWRP